MIWRVATILFAAMTGLGLAGDGNAAGFALLAVAALLLPGTVRRAVALERTERGDAEPLDPRVLDRMDDAADKPETVSHVRLVGGAD